MLLLDVHFRHVPFFRDQKLREKLYNHGSKESKDAMVHSWDNPGGRPKTMDFQEPTAAADGILNDDIITDTFNSQVHLELSADDIGNAGHNHPEDQIQNVDSSVQQQTNGNDGSIKLNLRKRFLSRFRRLSDDENESVNDSSEDSLELKTITDDELLHKYWKLVVRFFQYLS